MSKTVLFNPYTGTPRHPSDIASDPAGLLILDPDAPLLAAPAPPQGAPAPQQALTQAQRIRLWNNSPEYHGDVVGRDAFERLVKLVESVHRIGEPAPQRKALTDEEVEVACPWFIFDQSRKAWCEGFRAAERAHNIPQPDCEQEKTRHQPRQRKADSCPGCFSRDCNGECSGDGAMGD